MKNKKIFWILVAVFILLMVGAGVLYTRLGDAWKPEQLATQPTQTTQATEPAQTEPEEELADFTMYDLDGNPVKLSDFRGKPVVLNFWASWCGPCKSEMPDFQIAYEKYKDDLQFLMVNLTDGYSETVQSASSFIADAGYTFPVYYDSDQEAASVFYVNAIPTTYFIDETGHILAYAQGALNMETLEKGIAYIYP